MILVLISLAVIYIRIFIHNMAIYIALSCIVCIAF